MTSILSRLRAEFTFARQTYGLGFIHSAAIVHLPWILTLLFGLLQTLAATRRRGVSLLREDSVIENATFLLALAGGVSALVLAWRSRRHGERSLPWLLYACGGAGLLLLAMEEISWGQRWMGFVTPHALEKLNQQGELNLHNLPYLESTQKYLMILGPLVGIATARTSRRADPLRLRPPVLLAPLFAVVIVTASIELASYDLPVHPFLASVCDGLVELNEMLLAWAGLTYAVLIGRERQAEWRRRGDAGGAG